MRTVSGTRRKTLPLGACLITNQDQSMGKRRDHCQSVDSGIYGVFTWEEAGLPTFSFPTAPPGISPDQRRYLPMGANARLYRSFGLFTDIGSVARI